MAEGATKGKAAQTVILARRKGVPIETVSVSKLVQECGSDAHQGIVAHCREASRKGGWKLLLECTDSPRTVLILDRIEDPRNFGACLRTAQAFGASCVLAPRHGSAPLSPVAVKASAGAAETLPLFQETNLAHIVLELKRMGFFIYAADVKSERTIYEADLSGDIVWIIGGEGKGARRLLVERADETLQIPIDNAVESLNVSVVAGICLSETVRARNVRRRKGGRAG